MKRTVLNSSNTEVGNYYGIRTLLASVSEDQTISRELDDGRYIILQARHGDLTRPVFAFEVDSGNFRIRSVTGSDDIANLAAQVWHLRFTNKQKTALRKLIQLEKELSKIKSEIQMHIRRDESVKR